MKFKTFEEFEISVNESKVTDSISKIHVEEDVHDRMEVKDRTNDKCIKMYDYNSSDGTKMASICLTKEGDNDFKLTVFDTKGQVASQRYTKQADAERDLDACSKSLLKLRAKAHA